MSLNDLRNIANELEEKFEKATMSYSTNLNKWDWLRAVEDYENGSPKGFSVQFATNKDINKAWNSYIKALHEYYYARDGEHGFLGKFEKG